MRFLEIAAPIYEPPSLCRFDLSVGNALGPAASSSPAVPAPGIDPVLARNLAFVKPGVTPSTSFSTMLPPSEESSFRAWVAENKVPFDPNATGPQDYDMRGFYRGLMTKDPHAVTGMNPNDNQLHFSDYWKTPYHESFSAESQWADPARAPRWNSRDQLVLPNGRVVFDERAKSGRK